MNFILGTIISVLILANCAHTQNDFRYTYQYECDYQMISTDLPYSIDSIVADYFDDYNEFKIELTDSINHWIKGNLDNGYCLGDPCDRICKPDEIKALDLYDFTGDSTFILIRYWDYYLQPYFIGLCIKQHKWFPLSDIKGNETKINFNKILKLCPSLKSKSLLCKSVLLLGLKYGYSDNSILFSMDDINGLLAYNRSKENRAPDSLGFKRVFYWMGISSDTVLNKYFNQKMFDGYKISVEGYKDALSIIPPKVNYGESQDTVELTLFNRFFGEIAEWRLIFDKSGLIQSMDYINKPILTILGIVNVYSISQPRFLKYECVESYK